MQTINDKHKKADNLLIWVRRIVLLIVLVGLWPAYHLYDNYHSEKQAKQAEKYALVTANVWLATAAFHDDPERFIIYRDSLLAENELSKDKMMEYLDIYEKKPERYESFVKLVSKYFDSLYNIKQSDLRQLPDTVKTTLPQDST
ncbi:MAG: hypothetical protein U9R56_06890 [candidate division Zixibacteria bacterium]|nr:hypothetical protein [candidate division Zixibacteria bacterium]